MKELCIAVFLFIVFSIISVAAIAWTHHPEGIFKAIRSRKGEKKREHEKRLLTSANGRAMLFGRKPQRSLNL